MVTPSKPNNLVVDKVINEMPRRPSVAGPIGNGKAASRLTSAIPIKELISDLFGKISFL